MPPDTGSSEAGPLGAGRMQRFVAALLEQSGALVEPLDCDGLEVMAPPPLQRLLGFDEITRLGFGPVLPEAARRVGIEPEWLARCAEVIGERGRWSRHVLAPAVRRAPDAERLLDQDLGLDNATFRLLDVVPAWTRYLVLDFRFTALSEEKREGTVSLTLNLATGAMPERLSSWFDDAGEDIAPPAAVLPADWQRERIVERVRRALPWRVTAALQPFTTALRRRLARDQERLHGYYNDLHRDAVRAAQTDAGSARLADRTVAIARDYRAKCDDLAGKYALRTTVTWVQTLEVIAPVHRLRVQLRRRKAERVLTLDVNAARRLEPPPCEATWSTDRPRLVCDDALHLVSAAGLAGCRHCHRLYCRACHSRHCPKCGHAHDVSAAAAAG